MNSEVREFHTSIVLNEIDDIDLFKGFCKFYVSHNYTLKDLQDTLQFVYNMPSIEAIKITVRLTNALSFWEGS